jgi:hypothetical protein
MTNGNGESTNNGPGCAPRDWEQALVRVSATTFWKLL